MAQQPLYKRGRSTRLLVVGLVTASLVMITVDYRGGNSGPLEAAGRATLAVISPLQRAMSNLLQPVGDFFGTITRIGSLRDENARLTSEIADLRTELGDVYSLGARNEQLEKLLGLKEAVAVPSRAGRVIATGVSNFEWIVTINTGASDGVRVGDPVVGPDGLVGHVVKSTRNAADVQLILDPDSHVGGWLVQARTGGLLVGQRDNELRMDFVDPEAEVAPGELVETSGFTIGDRGSLYPPHIPIGRVTRVVENSADLQKQVWVEPHVDFSSLQYVLVLIT